VRVLCLCVLCVRVCVHTLCTDVPIDPGVSGVGSEKECLGGDDISFLLYQLQQNQRKHGR